MEVTSKRQQAAPHPQEEAWKIVQDEYELISLIGCGSFGQVVKARQKSDNKIVAIKQQTNIFAHEYSSKRFITELQLMRHLSLIPKNIFTVRLLNIKATADLSNVFIIMDYVDNDLKKILNLSNTMQFTETHVITLTYNILCALNMVHKLGIMHRDIKPENILVNRDCQVKICDFGLARTVPKDANFLSLSNNKQLNQELFNIAESGQNHNLDAVKERERELISQHLQNTRNARKVQIRQLSDHVVSRWYRSPEIILLEKNYDQAVDIWSLGCILAELIYCTDIYKNDEGHDHMNNRYLFKGMSCFPLSPNKQSNLNEMDLNDCQSDQFIKILEVLGYQNVQSLSFITEELTVSYHQKLIQISQQNQLKKMFSKTSMSVIKLLEMMLTYNPAFRPTVSECLKSEVFDSVRHAKIENIEVEEIELDILKMNNFDYDKGVGKTYSIDDYKSILMAEIELMEA